MAIWWLSSGSLAAGCCELVELPSSSSLRGGLCHPEPAYARGEDTASSSSYSSFSSSSYCSSSPSSSSSSLFWTTSHNPHTFYRLQHLRLSLFVILAPLQYSLLILKRVGGGMFPSKSMWLDPQQFPLRQIFPTQTSSSIPNPSPNIPTIPKHPKPSPNIFNHSNQTQFT